MTHPYETVPDKAFWRKAISERQPTDIGDLWEPKFNFLPQQRIATFGSCFAQHFSRELRKRRYRWLDAERTPDIFSAAVNRKFNYGIFSARTGNIYTAAMLRQWLRWALSGDPVPDEIWNNAGRYYDPFRPAIEPNGFASAEELKATRDATLRALKHIATNAHRFVFTLGLTEAWINNEKGYVYSACPGTLAGTFSADQHVFKNYDYVETLRDLTEAIGLLKMANERLRVLLTVSPVPLTATASGKHVLPATVYSKSVLRAVAGILADTDATVDYFPAYEIVAGTPFGALFYEANKRSVSADGVAFVMDSFFAGLDRKFGAPRMRSVAPAGPARPAVEKRRAKLDLDDDDLVCEEVMLDAFSNSDRK